LLWQAFQFRPEVDSFLDVVAPIGEPATETPAEPANSA